MRFSQLTIRSTPIASYTIRTLLGVEILFALGILAGGDGKWVAERYTILREFPGGPYLFGFILLVSAGMALGGSVSARRWKRSMVFRNVGFFAVGAWWFTYMISVADATTVQNSVPYTATIGCLLPIGVCAWLALIDERYRIDDREAFV
jgi:hypothetical protein